MLIVFVLVAGRFRLRAGVAVGRLQHELPWAGVRWPGHRGSRDLESFPLGWRAALPALSRSPLVMRSMR